MRFPLIIALVLVGCGYPDVDEVFGEGTTPATPTGSGGGDAGSGGAATAQGSGGQGSGATTGPGAASGAGASGTGGDASGAGGGKPSCDADGDGHQAEGACGGDDCDDAAADAHPGQDAYFGAPRSDGSFDWNCDGEAERETGTVSCTGALGCGFAEGDTGFAKEVECGEVAELGSCGGIPCTFDASTDLTQRCR